MPYSFSVFHLIHFDFGTLHFQPHNLAWGLELSGVSKLCRNEAAVGG